MTAARSIHIHWHLSQDWGAEAVRPENNRPELLDGASCTPSAPTQRATFVLRLRLVATVMHDDDALPQVTALKGHFSSLVDQSPFART